MICLRRPTAWYLASNLGVDAKYHLQARHPGGVSSDRQRVVRSKFTPLVLHGPSDQQRCVPCPLECHGGHVGLPLHDRCEVTSIEWPTLLAQCQLEGESAGAAPIFRDLTVQQVTIERFDRRHDFLTLGQSAGGPLIEELGGEVNQIRRGTDAQRAEQHQRRDDAHLKPAPPGNLRRPRHLFTKKNGWVR